MATVDAKQGVNEGELRKKKGSVRENKLIKMATNDARPLVTRADQERVGVEMGTKQRDRNGYG